MANLPVQPPKAPSSEQFLVEQIKALQNQVNDLQRVNKNALSRITVDQAKGMIVKISTYRARLEDTPKVVVKWENVKDYVDYTPGRHIEDQVMELTLEDETKVRLPLRDFLINALEKIALPVTSKTEKNGEIFFTVEYLGKEYTIGSAYIN